MPSAEKPYAFRPRGHLKERFEAFMKKEGLNSNQAALRLVEAGLDAQSSRADHTAPIERAEVPPHLQAAGRIAETRAKMPDFYPDQNDNRSNSYVPRRDTGAGWGFNPKGRK